MSKAADVVNHYYDICNNKQGDGIEALVATNVTFEDRL